MRPRSSLPYCQNRPWHPFVSQIIPVYPVTFFHSYSCIHFQVPKVIYSLEVFRRKTYVRIGAYPVRVARFSSVIRHSLTTLMVFQHHKLWSPTSSSVLSHFYFMFLCHPSINLNLYVRHAVVSYDNVKTCRMVAIVVSAQSVDCRDISDTVGSVRVQRCGSHLSRHLT